MKLGVLAAAVIALALLAAGCGGGDSTTVIERTVTVGDSEAAGTEGSDSTAGENAAEEASEVEEAAAEEAAEVEEKAAEEAAEAGEVAAQEAEEAAARPEDQIEEPTMVVHLQAFRSPSGNIGCAMYEGGARCDIRDRDWSPPAHPASCSDQVDYGQGLTVSHDGKASFVCAGDTTLLPSGTALGYGEASELGGTTCMSTKSGITCANHAGHGFFISVKSYRIF